MSWIIFLLILPNSVLGGVVLRKWGDHCVIRHSRWQVRAVEDCTERLKNSSLPPLNVYRVTTQVVS